MSVTATAAGRRESLSAVIRDALVGFAGSSPDRVKFDDLRRCISAHLTIPREEIACKYLAASRNFGNRVKESLHGGPRLLIVLTDLESAFEPLRARLADLEHAPTTLLVAQTTAGWETVCVLGVDGSEVFEVMRRALPEVQAATVEPALRIVVEPGPARADHVAFDAVISSIDLSSRSIAKFDELTTAVAAFLGVEGKHVTCKALTQRKNYYNRIGEALALRPPFVVILAPEDPDGAHEALSRFHERSGLAPAPVLFVSRTQGIWSPVIYSSPEGDSFRERVVPALLPNWRDSEGKAVSPGTSYGQLAELASIDAVSTALDASPLVEPASTWQLWTYADWNQRLVEYCLAARPGDPEPKPVYRLAATPDELAIVAGAPDHQAMEVADRFRDCVLENVPRGVRFCGFCLKHRAKRAKDDSPWSPNSTDAPPFFGMLWFTCLVQYGYPDAEGGFHERMWDLLGVHDQLTRLPQVWADMAAWTRTMRSCGQPVRELVLPPEDGFRTKTGASYFLAFPHSADRRIIAELLVGSGLSGFEPPLAPVLEVLRGARDRFSKDFRRDLDDFVAKYVETTGDPRDSPFWRAVRQEALDPSCAGSHDTQGRSSLLAVFDDDGLLPFVAVSDDWEPPAACSVRALDDPMGDLIAYVVDEEGELDTIAEAALASPEALLGAGGRALVQQGLLAFRAEASDIRQLATGEHLAAADVALVRSDLVETFVATFGGNCEPSRFDGWSEVVDCRVQQVDKLPPGLERVTQLLRTMNPPALRFVGGVRTGGGFLSIEGFLPVLRAPGANSVTVEAGGNSLECAQIGPDEWELPAALAREAHDVTVLTEWSILHPSGETVERSTRQYLRLEDVELKDSFKPAAAGAYYLEGCRPAQRPTTGGATIPLLVTTLDSAASIDLLALDASARYLGPGVGEMSLEPRPGFDWLAIGPKNRPDVLVFVGDPASPVGPANRRSPSGADRRHWRRSFAPSSPLVIRSATGEYEAEAGHPLVSNARSALRRHRTSSDAAACPSTQLEAVLSLGGSTPNERVHKMVEAVAALACRRSGLRYQVIKELLADLTSSADHILHRELVRAWAEAGAWDLVRRQDRSQTLIVPRRPRFVATMRGPQAEASLIGLLTPARKAEFDRALSARGLEANALHTVSPWQPSVPRVRTSAANLEAVSRAAGLEPVEWLRWDDPTSVPKHLDTDELEQGLRDDDPPVGFAFDACWNWDERMFRRHVSSTGKGVEVERRAHRQRCSIYVVLDHGTTFAWTYVKNWALLLAFALRGEPPFVLSRDGVLSTVGRSPVHLPLPWGRVCAVLGSGVPGPTTDIGSAAVGGYRYPLGPTLAGLVRKTISPDWLKVED